MGLYTSVGHLDTFQSTEKCLLPQEGLNLEEYQGKDHPLLHTFF